MSQSKMKRRAVLTGLGGAALGLPFLETLAPRTAVAQDGAAPKRLIIVYTSNGTVLRDWLPATTGSNFVVPKILKPFDTELLRPKLSVVSGVQMSSAKIGSANGHAAGMTSLLTGRPFGEAEATEFGTVGWGAGISIDQEIAKHVAAPGQLPSLQTGVQTQRQYGNFYSYMCYGEGGGSANAIVSEDDPKKVFNRLFANIPSAEQTAAELQRKVDQRKSVLDLVRGDFADLKGKLGAVDNERLERHASLIRDLEQRIVVEPFCARPMAPTVEDGRIHRNEEFIEITRNQIDLIATALSCDMTRVATLQLSTAQSGVNFKSLLENTGTWDQPSDSSHHALSHDAVPSDGLGDASGVQAAAVDKMSQVNTWFASQIAYLAEQLAQHQEEDGTTLLDNTAILWVSEVSEGPSHKFDDMPFVLLGDLQGALQPGHHAFGNQETHNNLYVTLGKAMGLENFDLFGDPEHCTGAIDSLLA